ncbi:hypothetical protein AQJ23_17105 [Streptomyces antibioticus]|nr:hypothetical protein [Streptomyces antibioticus]KUN25089.1 hypothetical protein AQJ23_17105 [Streptomyces antibioticus]
MPTESRACERIQTARNRLSDASTGDTDVLEGGFGTLASVLAKPGNGRTALNGFLRSLPAEDPCDTVTVADWLRDREPSVRDRSQAKRVSMTAAAARWCGRRPVGERGRGR